MKPKYPPPDEVHELGHTVSPSGHTYTASFERTGSLRMFVLRVQPRDGKPHRVACSAAHLDWLRTALDRVSHDGRLIDVRPLRIEPGPAADVADLAAAPVVFSRPPQCGSATYRPHVEHRP